MDLSKLMAELSKYGTVQICTAKLVFTLLLTGDSLSDLQTVVAIQHAITEAKVMDKYPYIECYRNDENYFCIVLRPKD